MTEGNESALQAQLGTGRGRPQGTATREAATRSPVTVPSPPPPRAAPPQGTRKAVGSRRPHPALGHPAIVRAWDSRPQHTERSADRARGWVANSGLEGPPRRPDETSSASKRTVYPKKIRRFPGESRRTQQALNLARPTSGTEGEGSGAGGRWDPAACAERRAGAAPPSPCGEFRVEGCVAAALGVVSVEREGRQRDGGGKTFRTKEKEKWCGQIMEIEGSRREGATSLFFENRVFSFKIEM